MVSFLGEHNVTLDAKGRFLFPVGFRKQMPAGTEGSGFVIARGMGTFLNLYTTESWEKFSEKLNRYNDMKPAVQKLKRLFLSGATPLELDTAGRLLLPKSLQEYAGLDKDLVLSSQTNRIEIWNSKTYYDYLTTNAPDMEKLANEVSGDDFFDPS